jgi:ActR/RegA family two-component response regulator
MSAILGAEGYCVTTAATVSEALHDIGQRSFDVLVSDLNIGEPGDGFTVVSAMRRTHPHCLNYILTGYPAFESALQAIRRQVDDYFVKCGDVTQLVNTIALRLKDPTAKCGQHSLKPLAILLSQNSEELTQRTLTLMRESPLLRDLTLTDKERVGHLDGVISELIKHLESGAPDQSTNEAITAAAAHGRLRRQQGYSMDMVVEDTRVLDHAIHDLVTTHLLDVDLSTLIPDLQHVNDGLDLQLEASVRTFLQDSSRKISPAPTQFRAVQRKKLSTG